MFYWSSLCHGLSLGSFGSNRLESNKWHSIINEISAFIIIKTMTYFNHNNDYPISIEEILIKPQTRTQIAIRQFILFNKRNGLKIVILNLGPKIVDCFVDHIHPIIYGHDHNHSEINDQNLIDYRANRIPGPNNSNNPNNDSINNSNNRCWDSHVFGFDAITLSHYILMEPIRTLTYSLNTENEFIIEGNNLLNFHNFLFNPFFFNLVIWIDCILHRSYQFFFSIESCCKSSLFGWTLFKHSIITRINKCVHRASSTFWTIHQSDTIEYHQRSEWWVRFRLQYESIIVAWFVFDCYLNIQNSFDRNLFGDR